MYESVTINTYYSNSSGGIYYGVEIAYEDGDLVHYWSDTNPNQFKDYLWWLFNAMTTLLLPL